MRLEELRKLTEGYSRENRRYKTLSDLAKAFQSGELDREEVNLILDNDSSHLSYIGPVPDGVDEDAYYNEMYDLLACLYHGEGTCDFQEACDALGIPSDWC